jgi:hypothetical protein
MTLSTETAAVDPTHPKRAFTLWIDGCGGFRLLTGTSWSVGGAAGAATCDIAVQTDWPRLAGRVRRQNGEYFWDASGETQQWLRQDGIVPIPGSATLMLRRPSPLSQSVLLSLTSSHRFAGHVDAVVLVKDTVLVGPGAECHARCRGLEQRLVLIEKDGEWRVKTGQKSPEPIVLGTRFIAENVGMTLENG